MNKATYNGRKFEKEITAHTMKHERVEITGLGFMSPLGHETEVFDARLFACDSAVESKTFTISEQESFEAAFAACAFDPAGFIAPSKLPADRATVLAMLSVQKAIAHSRLNLENIDRDRLGVYWGSGMGGASTFDTTCEVLYAQHKRIRPTSVITSMPSTSASEIALYIKAQGACVTIASACASSALAIAEGVKALRSHQLDVVIVGGSESMLTPGLMSAWNALRVMAPVKNGHIEDLVPFSKTRSGFAMGEGACAFVLQREEKNHRTGKRYFLSGIASNCDGQHMTKPNTQSQIKVMRAALKDATLNASDIDYINAHGTATSQGDASEARAIEEVFINHPVPVSSTKALHGHLLGASGALELLVCLRALENNALPPNAKNMTLDPEIKINVVQKNKTPTQNLRHALSNSFAFGGTNACLIISKEEDFGT
jgi:3-oxoacyl-[acyl-carrier-protein] synthase II